MSINNNNMSLNEPLISSNTANGIHSDEIYSPVEQHVLNNTQHVIDTISHSANSVHPLHSRDFGNVVMAPGAKPGEYISLQAARESNNLRACGVRLNLWVLLCICFLTFGSYWVFDTPGAIENQLEDWFGNGYDDEKN